MEEYTLKGKFMLFPDWIQPTDIDGVFEYEINIDSVEEPSTSYVRDAIARTLRLFPESTTDSHGVERPTIVDGQGSGPLTVYEDSE